MQRRSFVFGSVLAAIPAAFGFAKVKNNGPKDNPKGLPVIKLDGDTVISPNKEVTRAWLNKEDAVMCQGLTHVIWGEVELRWITAHVNTHPFGDPEAAIPHPYVVIEKTGDSQSNSTASRFKNVKV